jgi:NADPH2:quinone reductase
MASVRALFKRNAGCHTTGAPLDNADHSCSASESGPMPDLPAEMTAIGIRVPGGPEVLVPEQRPLPIPGPGEILVKVAAAGVNRPDVMQRKGLDPPPAGAPDIPGLEIAGEVAALGSGDARWKVGDAVCALVAGGGYAQYCLAHESHALPVPAGLSMAESAAIPETFFTVWSNVFERAGLRSGESILVHGGSSGIGTTAIQLAKAFGARVITTAGSDEKCAACVKLGAEHAINYNTQDFVAITKQATAGKGADVIVDIVGGDYIERNYEAAAMDGRVLQIAFQGSSKATVDFRRVMLKRLTHTGSTLRSRPVAEKAAIARAVEEKVWPLIAAGRVKPVIYRTFPLAEAAAAHTLMESSAHIGKIVLTA